MPDPVPNDAVSPNRGVMIVLAYLWLLALVPLLFEKTDREVQWHAKHGIVLMIAAVMLCVGHRTISAEEAPETQAGALLAAGITAWVVGQALINIGAVIGVLPVTGVPLPFVSFGGSSLVITMGAAGILLNIARQTR